MEKSSEATRFHMNTFTGSYNIYPTYPSSGSIFTGYRSLVAEIMEQRFHVIDGYIGVDWEEVIAQICDGLHKQGKTVQCTPIHEAMKPESEILGITAPFLGGTDPLFGKRTNLKLHDFFDPEKLTAIQQQDSTDYHIVYGTGAALCGWASPITYIDLPKYEVQQRMKKGKVHNLGRGAETDVRQIYKGLYFVDWIVLNEHKRNLLPMVSLIADQQVSGTIAWSRGTTVRDTLAKISRTYFRARPWFEPGIWGGDWMKEHFNLDQGAPNYAWSFELITPENGLLLSDGINTLEVSFDMLMFRHHEQVLGKAAQRFGVEFPIRFDFLDTFNGGNLSIQCHPNPSYIKEHFGENYTQDETYYIIDSKPGSYVYLGFREGVEKQVFRQALETSYQDQQELDVLKYVQRFPSRKHNLFLIPHGTVHSSGKDNLVLEISATPYIFTFKMYDWIREDLDKRPRPLNIDRAMENLDFGRSGAYVSRSLVSEPVLISEGADWKLQQLPTHPEHFYEIIRYEFESAVHVKTNGQCHILIMVEGTSMILELDGGASSVFHFAETIGIPAAAGSYTLTNTGAGQAKVVIAYVKDEAC